MKNIHNTIINEFYNKMNGIIKIDDYYVIKNDNYLGVALDNVNNITIDEMFSNVKINSSNIYIANEEINIIMLTSSLLTHKKEFALFCSQFLEYGYNNENRNLILNDPLTWWKGMRELIGNQFTEFKPYDIIAELLVLEHLAVNNQKPEWNGPSGSSVDVVSNDKFYEVKSTTVRYENQVTISSQFQLESNNQDLFLIYIKMEKLDGAESINKILKRLINNPNVNYELIIEKLKKRGYRENSSNRDISYAIHEIRCYTVDENFPKITINSFKDNKIHENIKKIKYVVDLNGIDYINWKGD